MLSVTVIVLFVVRLNVELVLLGTATCVVFATPTLDWCIVELVMLGPVEMEKLEVRLVSRLDRGCEGDAPRPCRMKTARPSLEGVLKELVGHDWEGGLTPEAVMLDDKIALDER